MASPTNPAKHQPGILYVEVKLTDTSGTFGRFQESAKIRLEVEQLIRRNYTEIKVGMNVPLGPPLAKMIGRIDITGYSKSKIFPDETLYSLAENAVEILVYALASDDDVRSQNGNDDDTDPPPLPYESISLPHRSFEGLWQTLIYEDPVGELALRTLTRAIKEQLDHPKTCSASSWQNTVLFHGPPGSGKTTLAQALAQRLSIRLSRIFQATKLLQIDAHTLFSRFYGETTKNIGQLFKLISQLASDADQLIVIIFDEVETVAASREKASQSNEPVEAATNEVLRGLDKLRTHTNVILFFTSNLISSLDTAFIDRCCIEKQINVPAIDCIFEMLRMEINELIQSGFVGFATMIYGDVLDSPGQQSHSLSDIPNRHWARSHWQPQAITAVSELYRIATLGRGLSGRKIKALLTLARYEHDPADLRDLLIALETVIREKTRQLEGGTEQGITSASAPQTSSDQADDVEHFLAELEADRNVHDENGQ